MSTFYLLFTFIIKADAVDTAAHHLMPSDVVNSQFPGFFKDVGFNSNSARNGILQPRVVGQPTRSTILHTTHHLGYSGAMAEKIRKIKQLYDLTNELGGIGKKEARRRIQALMDRAREALLRDELLLDCPLPKGDPKRAQWWLDNQAAWEALLP